MRNIFPIKLFVLFFVLILASCTSDEYKYCENVLSEPMPQQITYAVARVVEITESKKIKGFWDQVFEVKIFIENDIDNTFEKDTIEIVSFDHFGIPPYSKFGSALLRLVKYDKVDSVQFGEIRNPPWLTTKYWSIPVGLDINNHFVGCGGMLRRFEDSLSVEKMTYKKFPSIKVDEDFELPEDVDSTLFQLKGREVQCLKGFRIEEYIRLDRDETRVSSENLRLKRLKCGKISG